MGNLLAIHGGGLVDASKDVILNIANKLECEAVFDTIFLGKYSFMSMYNSDYWIEYNAETQVWLEGLRGTFLGTCRGIDLTDPDLFEQAIFTLRSNNVKTVLICGGDGSARQCSEIADAFYKNGINIIFAVPLTVDGINGGWSIGLTQAVRECVRQIENIAATSLETRDNGQYSVVAVELQGRNRDDILANTLQVIDRQGYVANCFLDNIYLRVVPANYETDVDTLIHEVNSYVSRTLILVSEGAKLKVSELQALTHRKVRTLVVGHAVQSNEMTTEDDMLEYDDWLQDVVNLISKYPKETFCIVNDGISRWREPIDYYAKLNPREGQIAELSKGLELLLKEYMV